MKRPRRDSVNAEEEQRVSSEMLSTQRSAESTEDQKPKTKAQSPNMKHSIFTLLLLILSTTQLVAQQPNLSEQMAATAMTALWHEPGRNENGQPSRWSYE